MDKEQSKLVYFEQQGNNKMCGLHCINSLLQGPKFTEEQMAVLANDIDEQEKALLGGDNSGLQPSWMESQNQAENGNYSIQVIQRALFVAKDNVGKELNLHLLPILRPVVKKSIKDYADEEAYICHSDDHWLSIRKLHGTWFNLNSTNILPGPQIISSFYLSVFLEGMQDQNYTVFVIRKEDVEDEKPIEMEKLEELLEDDQPKPQNEDKIEIPSFLPQPQKQENIQKNQLYVDLREIEDYHKENPNRPLNIQGAPEQDMADAIAASLAEMNIDQKPAEPQSDLYKKLAQEYGDDPDMIQAIMASMQTEEAPSQEETKPELSEQDLQRQKLIAVYGGDMELVEALMMSMNEEKIQKQ